MTYIFEGITHPHSIIQFFCGVATILMFAGISIIFMDWLIHKATHRNGGQNEFNQQDPE